VNKQGTKIYLTTADASNKVVSLNWNGSQWVKSYPIVLTDLTNIVDVWNCYLTKD
jgi:hypothetical protein